MNLFRVLTVIAALGTVLAAGYLLWLYQRTAFGEPTAEFANYGAGAEGSASDEAHGASSRSAAEASGDHQNIDEAHEIHDVGLYEWIAWTPLLIAIVVFGVYPQLMFKVMDPAVTNLLGHVVGK